MSDHDLRELERRYRASEELEDWVAWLSARLRAGELSAEGEPWVEQIAAGKLSREQLALCGYLGDPVALALDEHEALRLASYVGEGTSVAAVVLCEEGEDPGQLDVTGWLRGLGRFDERWVVLAQLALAERWERELVAEPEPEDISDRYDREYELRLVRRTLGSVRDALRDPSAERLTVLREYCGNHDYGWWPVTAALATARLALAWLSGEPVLPEREPSPLVLGVEDRQTVRTIRAFLLPRVIAGK
ncbi:MAG: hypothetical protein AB7N76_02560 [Planctomycetota bacterium]